MSVLSRTAGVIVGTAGVGKPQLDLVHVLAKVLQKLRLVLVMPRVALLCRSIVPSRSKTKS